jgi:type I restriction enzyme S subunit
VSGTPSIALGEIMASKTGSVDPLRFPNEIFDLYSIPAFDSRQPEVLSGREIGSAKQIVQPGDVLLSRIVPHIRRAWVVGQDRGRRLIASGEWIVFRSANAYPKYLRYRLTEDRFYAQFMNTVAGVGGSLLRARPAQVADIEISLPPLSEQQRIAGILEQADRLRRLRRYALELGDGLLQATFLDLFGHPSLNPMKWPTARLGDITENLDSRRIPVEASERSLRKGKYAYYGASGIIDYVQDFIFDEEALLVGEDGANLIARATPIAFVATGKYWVNNHAHVLRMTEKVNLRFLETFFSLTDLEPLVTGTAQPKLTAGKLNEIPVIIPPMALQKKFADIEAKSTGLRKVHRESLRQAEHLFQTLLHRAFTTGL